mmetsp:Transcript_33221/g.50107  ORF Transcript_33221/g.50107 Transcript_33221/m.50107 type:complete len:765 (-) Transcript_33221:297-2591(-)
MKFPLTSKKFRGNTTSGGEVETKGRRSAQSQRLRISSLWKSNEPDPQNDLSSIDDDSIYTSGISPGPVGFNCNNSMVSMGTNQTTISQELHRRQQQQFCKALKSDNFILPQNSGVEYVNAMLLHEVVSPEWKPSTPLEVAPNPMVSASIIADNSPSSLSFPDSSQHDSNPSLKSTAGRRRSNNRRPTGSDSSSSSNLNSKSLRKSKTDATTNSTSTETMSSSDASGASNFNFKENSKEPIGKIDNNSRAASPCLASNLSNDKDRNILKPRQRNSQLPPRVPSNTMKSANSTERKLIDRNKDDATSHSGSCVPLSSSASNSIIAVQEENSHRSITTFDEEEDDSRQRHNYYRNYQEHTAEGKKKVSTSEKANLTDQELMYKRDRSPGQMRLTSEGLKAHDDKIKTEFKQPLGSDNGESQASPCLPGYNAWKQRQDRKQMLKEKWDEQDKVIEEKLNSRRAYSKSEVGSGCSGSNATSPCKQHLISDRHNAYQDVADEESLERMGALAAESKRNGEFENSPLLQSTTTPAKKKKKALWKRRRSGVPRVTNAEKVNKQERQIPMQPKRRPVASQSDINKEKWLIREREKQSAATREKEQFEAREYERIQRNRELYLQKQRALENSRGPRQAVHTSLKTSPRLTNFSTTTSATDLLSSQASSHDDNYDPIEVNDSRRSDGFGDRNRQQQNNEHHNQSPRYGNNSEMFTLTTRACNDPCIVCGSGERTHLALPCMHYSFCEDCVDSLQSRNIKTCPVCDRGGTTYIRVF